MGEFGKGKTLSAVYLALLSAILHNRNKILTNSKLFLPEHWNFEVTQLTETAQLENIDKNTEILFDEIHKDVNSRDTQSKKNKFITNWIVDLRKNNIGIIGTVQFANTLDNRVWDMRDYKVVPQFKNISTLTNKPLDFQMNLFITDLFSDEIEIIDLNLEEIKDLYDTNYKPIRLIKNHSDMFEGKNGIKEAKKMHKLGYLSEEKLREIIEESIV